MAILTKHLTADQTPPPLPQVTVLTSSDHSSSEEIKYIISLKAGEYKYFK